MNTQALLRRSKAACCFAAVVLVLLVGSLAIAGLVVRSTWFWAGVSAFLGQSRAEPGGMVQGVLLPWLSTETQEQEADLEFLYAWAFVVAVGLAAFVLVSAIRKFRRVSSPNAT